MKHVFLYQKNWYLIFSWDFVLLFDGNSDSSPLLAKLSGSIKDGTFQSYDGQSIGRLETDANIRSTSNEMFMVFQSDDSEAWSGFKVQFDSGTNFKDDCKLLILKLVKWYHTFIIRPIINLIFIFQFHPILFVEVSEVPV